MKVKELIAKLQEFDGELEVIMENLWSDFGIIGFKKYREIKSDKEIKQLAIVTDAIQEDD